MTPELLRARTVLLTVGGSRAYGLHTDHSDVDVKGCCVPPAASVLGLGRRFEQVDDDRISVFFEVLDAPEREAADAHGLEGTVYDLRKLMGLALQTNPNILDVLFCRDAEVRICTEAGARLRAERHAFVTQRARQTYSGYAAAQLKRIRSHRAWLLSPPAAAPTRSDFDLPEVSLMPAQQIEAAEAAIRKQIDSWELDLEMLEEPDRIAVRQGVSQILAEQRVALGLQDDDDVRWTAAARWVGLADDLIEALKRERSYRAAKRAFRQYQHWKTHRNPDRAALEERYGYDTKHGAHLVRLLRMAFEILSTGRVHVWRGAEDGGPDDVEELQAIRRGAWSYEALVTWADAQTERIDEWLKHHRSPVPEGPDREHLDALCVELMAACLRS
ncbi:MAG: nucleotidyltransferase domain-containing protein [Myxococcales bacterium]|nr:nucleotidyltransferase domain-containing protein [Myxococcales bacterium]